ncbi:MAG: nucleotidyltransferase family protein [Xanthomonadaceae bacterium]|nr:nucleotidyltransferase family protein [Xanthomonadaceae bacterium]
MFSDFFSWLAGRLSGRDAGPLPRDVDALLAVAAEEGVLALLAAHCAQVAPNAVDAGFQKRLQDAVRQETMRELAQLAQAREVLSLLDGANIPVLVLKGTALAYSLYPSPALRPRCDLDLLVADRVQAKAAVAVLRDAGYVLLGEVDVDATAECEVALARPVGGGFGTAVDLHWQLINHPLLTRGLTFEPLWAQRVALPALHPQANGLDRMHALLHALLHRVTNFAHGQQNRLIWLYDIKLLAEQADAAMWEALLAESGTLGVAAFCVDGLLAAQAVLAAPVPGAVLQTLRVQAASQPRRLPAVPDQGAMDRAQLRALPWRARAGWLWRKLLPSPRFMQHRYGAHGPFALLRAYLHRWWVGLRRGLGG